MLSAIYNQLVLILSLLIFANFFTNFFTNFSYASPSYSKLPPQAAVATAHPLATQAGKQILLQGGNAFDAAVAVTAVLAVVEPYSSGLGGGGFWLLREQKKNKTIMLDGRETAPLARSQKSTSMAWTALASKATSISRTWSPGGS